MERRSGPPPCSLAVSRGRLLAGTDRGDIYCFSAEAEGAASVADCRTAAEFPYPDRENRQRYSRAAGWIVKQSGVVQGYCLVLDSGAGRLVYELARRTGLQVIGVEADGKKVEASRRALDRAGLYGRVVIHHLEGGELPYTDYLFNLVTSDACVRSGRPVDLGEDAERVLRPYGGVMVRGLDRKMVRRRGPLEGAGEWTHLYADPANTACSQNRLANGEMLLQWFGGPGPRDMIDRHHRSVSPLFLLPDSPLYRDPIEPPPVKKDRNRPPHHGGSQNGHPARRRWAQRFRPSALFKAGIGCALEAVGPPPDAELIKFSFASLRKAPYSDSACLFRESLTVLDRLPPPDFRGVQPDLVHSESYGGGGPKLPAPALQKPASGPGR